MKEENYLEDHLEDLKILAEEFGCLDLALPLLNNPKFSEWSASCHEPAHHYGEGGLLKHTWEVVNLCLNTAFFFKHEHEIDMAELLLSALYHDYGKLWDYTFDPVAKTYTGNNHRRTIHHIQRSAIEWQMIAREQKCDEKFMDRVTHNILSHHGRRDYGSPVAPLTREAYILHLSDAMSARVNDCDRLDLIKVPKH